MSRGRFCRTYYKGQTRQMVAKGAEDRAKRQRLNLPSTAWSGLGPQATSPRAYPETGGRVVTLLAAFDCSDSTACPDLSGIGSAYRLQEGAESAPPRPAGAPSALWTGESLPQTEGALRRPYRAIDGEEGCHAQEDEYDEE